MDAIFKFLDPRVRLTSFLIFIACCGILFIAGSGLTAVLTPIMMDNAHKAGLNMRYYLAMGAVMAIMMGPILWMTIAPTRLATPITFKNERVNSVWVHICKNAFLYWFLVIGVGFDINFVSKSHGLWNGFLAILAGFAVSLFINAIVWTFLSTRRDRAETAQNNKDRFEITKRLKEAMESWVEVKHPNNEQLKILQIPQRVMTYIVDQDGNWYTDTALVIKGKMIAFMDTYEEHSGDITYMQIGSAVAGLVLDDWRKHESKIESIIRQLVSETNGTMNA